MTVQENAPMRTRPTGIDALLNRVRSEYREMPGLRLTFAQAARFWCLDDMTCARLLDALVHAQFLARTKSGFYVWTGADVEPDDRMRLQQHDIPCPRTAHRRGA